MRVLQTLLNAMVAVLALCAIGLSWPPFTVAAVQTPVRLVVHATWKGTIGPASERYLAQALDFAKARSASALVYQLDTPGGLVTSMRDMISLILRADVPVIGYVAPPGAHAASAGTYILYATHVAAMAPGTNIGAATPILLNGTGSPLPRTPARNNPVDAPREAPAGGSTLNRKMTNDALALIRSLANLRGRNVQWAESAVLSASSLTAREALQRHVIDIVADNLPTLLEDADGRSVQLNERRVSLATARAAIVAFEPGALTEFLSVITNPNIALILVLLGAYGLLFELFNPGTFAPGILGAGSLVLGLYALNQLPLDYAGLMLLLLGIALMAGEAMLPTFGVLAIAGIAAFVAGAALLIDTQSPAYRISWPVIIAMAAVSAALLSLLLAYVWRAHRRAVITGMQELKGARARVLDWADGRGHVWLHGERWSATGPRGLQRDQSVIVDAIDGLVLRVDAERR